MSKFVMVFLSLAAAPLLCVAHPGLLDAHVTVANSAGLNPPGDFTLEAWIRPTLFHFDGDVATSYQQIMCKWTGGGTNQRAYLIAIYQDQFEFAFSTDGSSPNTPGIYSQAHLALNQWVHVAGVYAGGTMTIFINGEQDPQSLYVPEGPYPGQSTLYISGASASQMFHGGVDEVRISYVARYTGNFTPQAYQFLPDGDTALLMHMNEGSGTFTDNIGLLAGDGTLDTSAWGEGAPISLGLPGDLNCDGTVDFGDINPFVLALTDWSHYPDYYPNCDIYNADINADGYVDFADINPFVALLTGVP